MDNSDTPTSSEEIAAAIARLQAEELDDFLRAHLRKRDLHKVVANLNEAAMSKDEQSAAGAMTALKKLGFTD